MNYTRLSFGLLSLSLLLASCGSSTTPGNDAEMVSVQMGFNRTTSQSLLVPQSQLSPLGLPTGYSASNGLLKVKVYNASNQLVTFRTSNAGVYEPAGNGTPYLILDQSSAFQRTVLLPKGSYRFESIFKDGLTDSPTLNILGYSKTAPTLVDSANRNVQLKVRATLDSAASTLLNNTPVSELYTNDLLDLRLAARTPGGFKLPTTDFSVTYAATGGDLLTTTSSQLGSKVRVVGTVAAPTLTVTANVTGLVADLASETASEQTRPVTFSMPIQTATMNFDGVAPTAGITTSSVSTGSITLNGTYNDNVQVARARLYDGTTLIASSDAADQVAAITNAGNGTWSSTLDLGAVGDHDLTLIVSDTSGNEVNATRTVTVTDVTTINFEDLDPATMNVPGQYNAYDAASQSYTIGDTNAWNFNGLAFKTNWASHLTTSNTMSSDGFMAVTGAPHKLYESYVGQGRTTWISKTDGSTFNLVSMNLGLTKYCTQGMTVTAYNASNGVIGTLAVNNLWTSGMQDYTPANWVNVQRIGFLANNTNHCNFFLDDIKFR